MRESITVRVEPADCPAIWNEAKFIPADSLYRFKIGLAQKWNHFCIWKEKQKEKWPHHQLRKLRARK